MSMSKAQALAKDVANWRLQEYTEISFFAFYVYYVLTTMDKEISIIVPQRWNRGKLMYVIMRYGLLLYIAMRFARDYRTYFVISPMDCKVMFIIYTIARRSVFIACDITLGLCLSALLQARMLFTVAILTLSLALPVASAILNLVGGIQYPATPVSQLDNELGYPCYLVSFDKFSPVTVMYDRRDIRAYTELVATTLLVFLGIFTIVVRYRGQKGRLYQAIRRDGGVDYFSLLAIRLVHAIIYTPSVVSGPDLEGSPINMITNRANEAIITILAQRLLINMRKVDYVGSQPVASKLLFARTVPWSEDDEVNFEEEKSDNTEVDLVEAGTPDRVGTDAGKEIRSKDDPSKLNV